MSLPSLKNRNTISLTSISTMVHIIRQRQSTSGTTQANRAHHRRQRTPSHTNVDYLILKDTAGTGGLKVLSMYVRTFGYGMSTVVETKGPTDMFATMWAVKMLNFLGLSDIILQCDPEPSLIKWAESVKFKKNRKNSHSKFSQTVTSKQWRSRKLSGNSCRDKCDTMLAAMQEHTKYRPSADNALMRWIVRHAAWLIPRF